MGVCVGVQMSVHACVCMCTIYIYMKASKERARKESQREAREEKERKSRLIRETRMRQGSNCQPGCETDSRLSSSGG